jgi:hypothetical protein
MNKRHLHHLWAKVRILKPWYFLALRANNQHMAKLRTAVYSADKNDTDVQAALNQLQAYVTAHMNTNLTAGNTSVYPPIQLKYTYQRLQDAQSDQLANANTDLYTDAQHYCEQQDPVDFSGHNRVPCIENYVETHDAAQLPAIPDALYKFSFVSPTWSPDLAGWSLLVTIVFGLLFVLALAVKLLAN